MLAVIYTTGFKPFFSRASPETEKHGVLYRNKFQEKHDEESTATKGYSIFDPYFLQCLCRQFADSEALYHADACTHDLCVRRVSDLAENPRVLLWHHFGNCQRICGEFCLYLSLLCLRLFRGGKHLICRHYAGSCRFYQHAEYSYPRSGEAALRE